MESSIIPYQAVTSLGRGPVLALAPHPDDEVLGCGGALLRHSQAGDAITVIIVTDGGYGQERTAVLRRRQESRCAARVLGYGEPRFWDLPDRGLCYGEALVRRLGEAIDAGGIRLVYAPSIFEIHPDHRALAMAAVEAVRRRGAAVSLAMYEVGVPLWPNRLLDITDLQDQKRRAVGCFASQLAAQPYDRQIEALNRFRTYTLPRSVTAAEAYFMTDGERLRQDPLGLYVSEAERQRRFPMPVDAFDQPLVSVIVRTLGRPQLAKALDSIALQTYPRIEARIIDARGAGDLALGQWCGRFPLSVHSLGRPLPRSAAANLGLDQAEGEYVIFLDDDDYFYPDHIAALVAALQQHPQAKVAYAGVRMVTLHQDGAPGPVLDLNERFDLRRLRIENFIPIHAALFPRALPAQAGCRFDETLDRYEDWDFWLQLAQHSPFIHVDRISACYCNHGASGFGIDPDNRLIARARGVFFEKWKARWSGAQLGESLEYAKNHGPPSVALEDELKRVGAALRQREQQLIERDRQLREQAGQLAEKDRRLAEAEQGLAQVYRSTSWRITAPLRQLKSAFPWALARSDRK